MAEAGYADIGWSNSLGCYERAFACSPPSTPPGSFITGLCFGAASTADQHLLAETFFAVRAQPNPKLSSVGSISSGPYNNIADKGFEGAERTTGDGCRATGRSRSSIHPNATTAAIPPGPSA